jgi:hypothetical protein
MVDEPDIRFGTLQQRRVERADLETLGIADVEAAEQFFVAAETGDLVHAK